MSENISVIKTGIIDSSKIDMLKEFPKEMGVQRVIDNGNLNSIKESMRELYIPSRVIVNKDWFILDGQHSVRAIKELGLKNVPVIYTMIDTKGKDIEICVKLNTTSKNWNNNDFLDIWCNNDIDDYLWFKEVKDEYGLSYQTLMYIVSGLTATSSTNNTKEFRNGNMKIDNFTRIKSIRICEQLKEIMECVSEKVRGQRSFHNAYVKFATNKNYDHKRMMRKIDFQYDKIKRCTGEGAYFDILAEIYNYKETKDNKVDFN